MKKKIFKGALFFLGIIIIIFLLIGADFREVIKNIRSIPIGYLVIASALQIVTMVLLAIQWKAIVGWTNKKLAFKDVFLVNIKGNIVDFITPGVKVGGELARIYELRKTLDLDTANASIIVGLQKTISLLSFSFLSLISLIWFNLTLGSKYRHYSYLFSSAVTILILLLALLIIICLKPELINHIINRIPVRPGLKAKLLSYTEEYYRILLDLLSDRKGFAGQLLLGVLIWGLFAFKMLLIVTAFKIKINIITIGAITYLTYIVGMIPLLPGSIGSFEASMVALLATQNIPLDMAISISIIFRFITFWFEFLLSLLIYIIERLLFLYRKGGKYAREKA